MSKQAGAKRRGGAPPAASAIKPVDETMSEGTHNKKPPARTGRPLGKKVNKKPSETTQQDVDVTVDDNGEDKRKHKKKTSAHPGGKGGPNVSKISAEVEAAFTHFVTYVQGQKLDGLRKEFADLKAYTTPNMECKAFTANDPRNRYKDVVCIDSTRVVLTLNVPPETDYIHANWVRMEGVDKPFIAAQGPIDTTIPDFWRMIHQETIASILMLCKVEEGGKAKCAQYWPLEQGAYNTYGCMFVNCKKVEKEDERFVTYTLEVLPEGCSNSTIVKLYQMLDWPDKGVPISSRGVLRLAKCIPPASPCVVHCSAGIGRTGTIIAVDVIISRLLKGHEVSVIEIFKQLRDQRSSMIQTEGQYAFVYLCILSYINAKSKKFTDALYAFQDEFKKATFNYP